MADFSLGKKSVSWEESEFNLGPAVGCSLPPGVYESGLCWGGQPEAHSEASRGRPCPPPTAPTPELGDRYSGDRHIRGAFLWIATAPRWLESPSSLGV